MTNRSSSSSWTCGVAVDIGIIGLPQSGKTTVVNALTLGHTQAARHAPEGQQPNLGVVNVPDPRLEALARLFKPRRIVPANVRYSDVGAVTKGTGREAFSGQLLNYLSRMDGLIHVVRAFRDEGVPHIEGAVDPARDIATIHLELAFSDIAILERRLERLQAGLKAAKTQEREAILREQAWLKQIQGQLEQEVPLREHSLTEEQLKVLQNFQFLTAKPLLILLNIGEEQLGEKAVLEEEYRQRLTRPGCQVAALCGQLEMELGQMGAEDAREFRTALGVSEAGLELAIRLSYELLGLVTFYTTGSDEVKAWTVRRGASAPQAAGRVHSDMEHGFIRAEVIGFEELMECRGMVEARRRGLLRLEGREYQVKDGDVITFLFNL